MKKIEARIAIVLLLVAGGVGCINPHRIDGPNYSAEGPPFKASHSVAVNEALVVSQRLLLIGDAGLFLEDDPTLAKLGEWSRDAANSTVVFLGDNIYNEGLVEDDRERGEQVLAQQLGSTDARKILVPGNHDWGLFEMRESSIENQQTFVAEWGDGSAEFVPRDGCMGPVVRRVRGGRDSRAVTLVLLDPTPIILDNPSLGCAGRNDLDSHVAALDSILAEHEDDWVVVASHYPLETGGPHGGLSYGSWLVDGLLNVVRFWAGGAGDTYDESYAKWIAAVTKVMRKHPPEVYAAGHDHNLQILAGNGYAGVEVISGAGAKGRVSAVTHLPSTLFAHAAMGFVVVDFGRRGEADVAVLRVLEAAASEPVFEMDLPESPRSPGAR